MPRRAGDSDFQGRTFWNKRCWGLTLEEEGSHADDERMQKTEKRNSRQREVQQEGRQGGAGRAAAVRGACRKFGFARKGSVGAGRWEEAEESLDAVRSLQMASSLGSR